MERSRHVQLQKLTMGDAVPRAVLSSRYRELPQKLRQQVAALGTEPQTTLEVFVDLGLSDGEIADYFRIPETCVAKLCTIWGVR